MPFAFSVPRLLASFAEADLHPVAVYGRITAIENAPRELPVLRLDACHRPHRQVAARQPSTGAGLPRPPAAS
ncbi:hypothetical protein DQ392_19870 [Streptomyces reniochalinae]|uniref:Uncharacterized protein n=1 Tax=Streptomyces reniochalinae TaxID=2250578 RepID=A0A367EEA9_9ACTN|nr:hypothetical protein DQ392_19870 [Streptomyces reniochalinae]